MGLEAQICETDGAGLWSRGLEVPLHTWETQNLSPAVTRAVDLGSELTLVREVKRAIKYYGTGGSAPPREGLFADSPLPC